MNTLLPKSQTLVKFSVAENTPTTDYAPIVTAGPSADKTLINLSPFTLKIKASLSKDSAISAELSG